MGLDLWLAGQYYKACSKAKARDTHCRRKEQAAKEVQVGRQAGNCVCILNATFTNVGDNYGQIYLLNFFFFGLNFVDTDIAKYKGSFTGDWFLLFNEWNTRKLVSFHLTASSW